MIFEFKLVFKDFGALELKLDFDLKPNLTCINLGAMKSPVGVNSGNNLGAKEKDAINEFLR